MENTPPEAQEISQVRGFCTPNDNDNNDDDADNDAMIRTMMKITTKG